MATSERPVILVVDGDEATRLLFTRTLTGAGFDVAAAADGAGAVAILDDRPIRTVVFDKQLAEVTGPPIIERLRAEANARSLPLILVTNAPTDIIDEVAGFGAGATDFLVKPVDLDELVVRVKAEVRVNDVLERARRIAETTTDAFVSFDEEDLILAWAGQAEQVFGWSEPEAIGRRFGDMLLAPHHRPGHALRVRRFLDLGEQPLLGEWVELVGLHRDGREFPIEITEWGLYTNGRHSIHAFIRDVSRQRQTQRVQQQANPSGSHFAAIADLIMLSEPAGRIVYVSPSVQAALGWDADRLVGTPRMDLLHPDDRLSAEQEATELDAGSDVTGACRFRRSDGTYTWMEFSRYPIFDRATREVIGVRTVAREITKWLADEAEREWMTEELRVANAQLREGSAREFAARTAREARAEELHELNAQLREGLAREHAMVEELHELDRMKSNFVAQVSHEVRTPLTNIVGYVEMMRDSQVAGLSRVHRKMLEVIERNVQRLTRMVEDLLTVGEIESDAFSIKAVPMDLVPVIELAAETVKGRATLQGIDLSINITGDLGPVGADAFHVERVLLHLLSNAVKFTPAGGRIGINARRTDNEVLIKVSDTGVGIPLAEQDRIFDRFYRCERSIDDAAQGAGMGLAISKAVVERHGGTIRVESAPDEGTTMTVTLPVVAGAEPHEA